MRLYNRNLIAAIGFATLGFVGSLSGDAVVDRWSNDIEAFNARDEAEPQARGGIVCVGSSSMRMWSHRMKTDLHPLALVPLGFGGSQFADVNAHFDALVKRYAPRAVLVYEGDNDIASGKDPIEVTRDFLTLVDQCHQFNKELRIYVISVKPSVSRQTFWEASQRANRMMEALCSEDDRLTYIDVSAALLGDDGIVEGRFFVEDGIHLNAHGYDNWASSVRHVIVPLEEKYEIVD